MLTTLQVLGSYMWLVIPLLDSANEDHFCHHRERYCGAHSINTPVSRNTVQLWKKV